MTAIDVVIVAWNAREDLDACLASVAAVADADGVALGRVVVVDNGSTDGTADSIAPRGLPLELVRNAANRGFAAACNQGARRGAAELVLFLNPDARLLPGALAVPARFLASAAGRAHGIAGVQLVDERGRVQRTCSRFPTARALLWTSLGLDRALPRFFRGPRMREWDHAEDRTVDQVMGAFFLVRRALFDELGGFDERFFVYYEEVDLSLRAARAGWRSIYCAGARAVHRGGGSSRKVEARRLYYSLRSRLLYAGKHLGRPGAAAVWLWTLLAEPPARLAWSLARRSPRSLAATARGYALLARWLARRPEARRA